MHEQRQLPLDGVVEQVLFQDPRVARLVDVVRERAGDRIVTYIPPLDEDGNSIKIDILGKKMRNRTRRVVVSGELVPSQLNLGLLGVQYIETSGTGNNAVDQVFVYPLAPFSMRIQTADGYRVHTYDPFPKGGRRDRMVVKTSRSGVQLVELDPNLTLPQKLPPVSK